MNEPTHHRIDVDYQIHFAGKWHAGSGEGSVACDRLVGRDSRGRPYVPGATLRGLVRENCEKLSRTLNFPKPSDPHRFSAGARGFGPLATMASPVDAVFGNKYEESGLYFRDARLAAGTWQARQHPRIGMYRRLKTAKTGHLFTTEYVTCTAETPALTAHLSGFHRNLVQFVESDPPYGYWLLLAGIALLSRIGGDRSVGSGWIESVRFIRVVYNGAAVSLSTIGEYLNGEEYREWREA